VWRASATLALTAAADPATSATVSSAGLIPRDRSPRVWRATNHALSEGRLGRGRVQVGARSAGPTGKRSINLSEVRAPLHSAWSTPPAAPAAIAAAAASPASAGAPTATAHAAAHAADAHAAPTNAATAHAAVALAATALAPSPPTIFAWLRTSG